MTTLTKQIMSELAYGRVEAIRPARADLIAALRDRADDECDAVDAALMRMAAEMLARSVEVRQEPSPSADRLCKDCIHSRDPAVSGELYEGCAHPSLARIDPVSGKPLRAFCRLERASFGACKPEGRLWEAMPQSVAAE